jgi:lipopolysaccharide/colanic/teichoic acid biosynthesis glycosyltransferase
VILHYENCIEGEIFMATLSPPIQTIISLKPGYLRSKRLLDILFTMLILLPLCLLIAAIAMLLRFDSKGPIFFRQKRVGLNGREFYMLKFRSMYVNCDDLAHREAIKRYMNGGTINGDAETDNPYKLANDPRVTRVGRILRKYSIDELPQFINVLHGEMTLVGPRPPVPYEVEQYSIRDQLRLAGKPGLTGTWQVYGRSKVPFHEMVEMDIAYLNQQSIWQDLKLIALTVPVMLQGRGGG